MATAKQYEVFKHIYDEEIETYKHLEARARFYMTIITFYVGAIFFKFEDSIEFVRAYMIPAYLYLLLAVLLLSALLFTVLAVRIRSYEGICDPEEVIHGFNNEPPEDVDFLNHRIVDLAVATNRNSDQNSKVATNLYVSAWLIFAAVVLQLFIFVYAFTSDLF